MARPKPLGRRNGASKRLEALTDGVFAIVATLLVLEIRIPELEKGMDKSELLHSLQKVIPSFVAFVFSFMNIMIFWMNHDAISQFTRYFNRQITHLNIIFLLFICMVPFTSRLISEYPDSLTAITLYGMVLLVCSLVGAIMYWKIAFGSDMMMKEVSLPSRKRVWQIIKAGPLLFMIAMIAGLFQVYIPVIIYCITPIVYLFLPGLELNEIIEEETTNKS